MFPQNHFKKSYVYSSNRAPDILQTWHQKVLANLFLLFSWSHSLVLLRKWDCEPKPAPQRAARKDALSLDFEDDFSFPATVEKLYFCADFLLYLLYLVQWSHLSRSGMHSKVQTIMCAYCMQHGRPSFSPAALLWPRWGGLCRLEGTEGHLTVKLETESQMYNGWGWMGPLEIIQSNASAQSRVI